MFLNNHITLTISRHTSGFYSLNWLLIILSKGAFVKLKHVLLTFSARAAEGQSGVHLIFYLDQGIKNHWATATRRKTKIFYSNIGLLWLQLGCSFVLTACENTHKLFQKRTGNMPGCESPELNLTEGCCQFVIMLVVYTHTLRDTQAFVQRVISSLHHTAHR